LDYDSFSPFGGEAYFQKASDILNNIPTPVSASNPGWRSIEGNRNRYWIIENLLSPRVRPYRQAMYDYHRQALDVMASDANAGRAIMVNAIEKISQVNQTYPNAMIIQMFANAKSNEIVSIFLGAPMTERNKVIQVMSKIDPTNSSKYRTIRG
jgi:hypothetical protein